MLFRSEISLRVLGKDSATFGYVTIPTNLWHREGAYEILDTTTNIVGSFMGYGRIYIIDKTENSFKLKYDGDCHGMMVAYKLKKNLEDINVNNYGAVVESGSNDLGSWIKFSDGTMIVWKSYISVNSGEDRADITFPQQFYSSDVTVQLTNRYTNAKNFIWSAGNFTRTGFTAFPLTNAGGLINADGRALYIAIGRWK